jgi:hypothetical protein
MLKTF